MITDVLEYRTGKQKIYLDFTSISVVISTSGGRVRYTDRGALNANVQVHDISALGVELVHANRIENIQVNEDNGRLVLGLSACPDAVPI
jgi:hypothetical protein